MLGLERDSHSYFDFRRDYFNDKDNEAYIFLSGIKNSSLRKSDKVLLLSSISAAITGAIMDIETEMKEQGKGDEQ